MDASYGLTMTEGGKRILLFNAKRELCEGNSPHLGLAMLTAALKRGGHEVLVVDYQFKHGAPPPRHFVESFRPDVVGVTLYTATMKEADRIIDEVHALGVPIVVGGPHATLYHDELGKDQRLSCVVAGEAENVVCAVVEGIGASGHPKVVLADRPDPKTLPHPDFSFYGAEDIRIYPMQTSRGCPHSCCFCVVHLVSTKKWRPRVPEECVVELERAKERLPGLKSVIVYDDNPSVKMDHLKEFLRLYVGRGIGLPLTVVNTRADGMDEETIMLLKSAGCPGIGLGVESGCREVFDKVGKGETLEEIRATAELVKKHGIPLHLCFVIGLEGDSLERTKDSIRFARELKPDLIFWNMITPFKGTRIREWYDQHGRVYDVVGHSSYVDASFMCDEPCAESPEFPLSDRKKAYLMAIMGTVDDRLRLRHVFSLLPMVSRHGLWREFGRWLVERTAKNLVRVGGTVRAGMVLLRERGPRELGRRIVRSLTS